MIRARRHQYGVAARRPGTPVLLLAGHVHAASRLPHDQVAVVQERDGTVRGGYAHGELVGKLTRAG